MTMKVRVLLGLVVLLGTMGLGGCGHYTCGTTFGNSTCTPSGNGLGGNPLGVTTFVYFMDDFAAQMAMEGLNVSNSQTYAPVPTFVSPTFPKTLGLDGGLVIVKKKYLYMPFTDGSVYAFSIDATSGALTAIGSSIVTVTAGGNPTVVADPVGNFLFVGNGNGIFMYSVSSTDGSLSVVTGSPFSTGGVTPIQLATDGAGKFLYMLDGSTITAFSYTSLGLTPVGSPLTSPMQLLAAEQSGKFMLGITEETGGGGGAVDDNIYVFSIGSTGALTALPPFSSGDSPAFLAVSPNGSFVYTFNESVSSGLLVTDPMRGFVLDGSGSLSAISTSPFTGLDASIGRFDQSGQYIFAIANVPGSGASGVFPYGVNSSGGLSSTLAHAGVAGNYTVTDEP